MDKLFHISKYKLSTEAINGIISLCEQLPAEEALFDGKALDHARRSELRWVPKQKETQPIFDLISFIFNEANTDFKVDIIPDIFPIQYTTYHAANQGHYEFHSDVHWPSRNNLDRKLSFVMQLSDPDEYTGGQFQFQHLNDFPYHQFVAKGSILVFPSALFHRVTPVTSGTRRSLVSWIEGPCWR